MNATSLAPSSPPIQGLRLSHNPNSLWLVLVYTRRLSTILLANHNHNPSTWSTAKKITTGKRRQNAEPKYQNAYPTSNRNSPSHPTHHGGGLYNHGRLVSHSPFIRPLPQPHAPIRTYLSHHLSPHALFWRAGHDIWLASIHYHNQRPSLQDLRFEHGAVFGVQCLVCGGVAGIRCGARRGNRVDVHESTPLGFCRELCFYGWEFVGC